MKRIALILAALSMILARPAHADTMNFTWESQAWVKTYESPTQFTVTGPFTLSGTGAVTFGDLAAGGTGRNLSFGGSYGGTLIATGDGTYNGPMTFPTSAEPRNGLGVLTPTADGFTVVVHRAASGPDAGAAFWGVASPLSTSGHRSATASEPALCLTVGLGLAAAARLRTVRRGV
jgi:hypothetical protein